MVENVLAELGLGAKETQVYLTVLRNGKITPAQIARLTKINRTTVYSLAKELIDKGIITEDLASPTRHLVALPPDDLMNLAKQEEDRLEQKRKVIEGAIGELKEVTKGVKYSIPKITFIGEEEISRYLHKRTPTWNASAKASGQASWGFQDSTLVQHYGDWIEWYWKQPSSKNIAGYFLAEDSKHSKEFTETRAKHARRHIKYWQPGVDFTSTMWAIGESVILLSTANEPHYLVEIVDNALAENMRIMFKGLWGSA
jgi:hypothetical protein